MPTLLAPPVRVACLGDSITYGHGLADQAASSYPAVLQSRLGPGFEVRNFGVNGATLFSKGDKPYRKERAFRSAVGFDPNVVVLALGTNDSKPQNWRHAGDLAADVSAFVEAFRTLPGKPVIVVCLPPPVAENAFGISEARLQELRPMLTTAAKDRKLTVIDLNAALAGQPGLFPDGVHPNAAGARAIAEAVAKAIR